MPGIFKRILDGISQKDAERVNTYEGFKGNGAIVLRDNRGTRKEAIPEVSEKGFGGGDPLAIYKPTGTKAVSAEKAMAQFTGWTFAAVNAIAMEAVGIQLRLYRVTGKEHTEIDDHELLDLLAFPNETQIGQEFTYTMMAHLELTGNFYAFMDGMKSATSVPKALFPLNPGRVRVILDKSAFPYRVSGYEFTIDGKIIKFKPEQILHIRYPDPNDVYLGIGFPQTVPVWIDSDNLAMEYNRKFFSNGAQVGLYIQTDTNVEGNIDRIRKGFQNRQEGVDNAHRVPVLPKGTKLEHTGVTHKDMDFSDLADKTRDRILAAARVSKTILGTAESDTNRSTAETADYVFSKRTMKPKMDLIVAHLNAKLVPFFGDDLYLTYIDPTPEDREFRAKEMQAAMGNAPVMTPNEARKAYLGLGPVDGGDKLMSPTLLEPIGTTSTPEGEDQSPNLAKTAIGWSAKTFRIRTGGKSVGSAYKSMQKELADLFKAKIESAPFFQVKSVTELSHSEYMEHWKRFSDRTEAALAALLKVFLGINARQRDEVLKNLPEVLADTAALATVFDIKEWIDVTVELSAPIITSLAKDEATEAFAMIGAPNQDILADDEIRDALERGISKMATSYNETTLSQLKAVLHEKMTQDGGTDLKELTEAVDGVYSYADGKRAGLIAQTESYRASNWANKEAWRKSGVVKTVQWYSAEDGKVCQFCETMEKTGPVPIDSIFAEAGAKIMGTDGGVMTADYGDVDVPPLHPRCRCYLRPQDISTE